MFPPFLNFGQFLHPMIQLLRNRILLLLCFILKWSSFFVLVIHTFLNNNTIIFAESQYSNFLFRFESNYIIKIFFPAKIPPLFKRCLLVDMTSRRGATSNQLQINVVYFNPDVNNARQCLNNVVFINLEFLNVNQRETTL